MEISRLAQSDVTLMLGLSNVEVKLLKEFCENFLESRMLADTQEWFDPEDTVRLGVLLQSFARELVAHR